MKDYIWLVTLMVQKQLAHKYKLSSTENKTRTISPQKRLLVYKHYICFVRLIDFSIKFTYGSRIKRQNTLETNMENSGDKKETRRGPFTCNSLNQIKSRLWNKKYLHGLYDGPTILINENFKGRVYEIITNDANAIVKRFRNCLWSSFVKFLNQIESSFEINK